MIGPGDKVGSWRASCGWNIPGKVALQYDCGRRRTDDKMDRRTAADGNGRICESLVISTSEGGQTYYMTISRTDPFTPHGF